MAGVALLTIVPAGRLPNYLAGEIPPRHGQCCARTARAMSTFCTSLAPS
jgi:hypothetical protein